MPIREETRYNIEVPHPSEHFKQEMDFWTSSPEGALKHYLDMRQKYPGREIRITRTTTIIFEERVSQGDLEIDVDRASD